MTPSCPSTCLPYPWVLDVARFQYSSSVVVRNAPELKRCLEEGGLTELRLRAVASLREAQSVLVARADATRIELLRAIQEGGLTPEDVYLDLRLGQLDLVIRLRS